MVVCIGPLATIRREPGQARKGAAVAADSSAGVRLVQTATLFPSLLLYGVHFLLEDFDLLQQGARNRNQFIQFAMCTVSVPLIHH